MTEGKGARDQETTRSLVSLLISCVSLGIPRCGYRVTHVLYNISGEEFYQEFGWHEYRLLIGKVIKRCCGSDYRERGNYRKGKEASVGLRPRTRARSTFQVIFHVPPRRLSPRWIAKMEFAPAIFYVVCYNALARLPINIEDYNLEGRAASI